MAHTSVNILIQSSNSFERTMFKWRVAVSLGIFEQYDGLLTVFKPRIFTSDLWNLVEKKQIASFLFPFSTTMLQKQEGRKFLTPSKRPRVYNFVNPEYVMTIFLILRAKFSFHLIITIVPRSSYIQHTNLSTKQATLRLNELRVRRVKFILNCMACFSR